jgi:hypothetical protein
VGASTVAAYPGLQTQDGLLTQLPASNIPGVLPRDILPPGERVLYETRPGLFSLFGGRLIFIALWTAIWVYGGIVIPDPIGAGILGLPTTIWLAILLLQWRHRVYALTDQRVIRISGMRGSEFQDAAYTQIHNLTSESDGIRFDTTPPPSVGAHHILPRGRSIKWDSISDVPRVYTFVQEAFAVGLRRLQENAVTQAAIDRITSTSVRCQYCGGLINLATMDPSNPRCPSCNAPVILPT